jgi:hypothetical protein
MASIQLGERPSGAAEADEWDILAEGEGPHLCFACAEARIDAEFWPGAFAENLKRQKQFEEFEAGLAGLPAEERDRRVRAYVNADMERIGREHGFRRPEAGRSGSGESTA